ncbi:MAG: ROK family protein [Armatimonadota bacterium]
MATLAPNPSGRFAIGVDVGGTNIRAGVITPEGKKLSESRRPARAMEGIAVTLQMIVEAIEEALANAGGGRDDLMGVGLGVPGRHNSDEGLVYYSPNFAGWTNIQLLQPIEEHFRIAAYMRNDVKTASMGEYYFGAGRGYRYIVMITLGTGIGGSLIYDGKLMLSHGEGFAEVGHMTINPTGRQCECGNHGCWEAMAGRDAIIDRALRLLQSGRPSTLSELNGVVGDVTPAVIARAAADGDALALEVMEETGMWVGIGVANLIQVYNPEVFIIGGGISQAGDLLFGPIQRTVNWRAQMVPASTCKIVPAALSDDAGIFGGAVLVFEGLKQK